MRNAQLNESPGEIVMLPSLRLVEEADGSIALKGTVATMQEMIISRMSATNGEAEPNSAAFDTFEWAISNMSRISGFLALGMAISGILWWANVFSVA